MEKGTKGDAYTKEMIKRILTEGCPDINPRPKYEDGTPAHTLSVNHVMMTYDLTKGESPLITLRPIAVKSSIGELLWIYQDASNDLKLLKKKYGVKWWDKWDIGDGTIGKRYGATVKEFDQTKNTLIQLIEDPDSRRHDINLWQLNDFKQSPGLKPCAYNPHFNVRHEHDGIDYLDMRLLQRSSDFIMAGCINQVQYLVLLMLFARHCGYTPGRFTWWCDNVQIYDRHIDFAKEMLNREPVDCEPYIWLNPDKRDFYDFTIDDIKVEGYPRALIKKKNPAPNPPLDIGI